ncbi:HPP family protein [Halobaculum marinum]|uniref:HPP family protein n=1 Tax=Halobaculum marinum TaxID=3031996 RepID=A0ABD5WXT9_9EURY|nr:HPP family protein [Halobaculum sp. DT55]
MADDAPPDGDSDGETPGPATPGIADRAFAAVARAGRCVRRIERRELVEFRRWIENTENLLHLTVVLVVPLVVALVTELSNSLTLFSFLLFPPLASGSYTLFANPGGEYADPKRFVGGLTVGAACGWAALRVIDVVSVGSGLAINPTAAAFSILLAGVTTWALGVEEPSAYSASLLVLAAPDRAGLYVLFTLVGSTLVAGVFLAWRHWFYDRRASLLYESIRGDDNVIVPMRGEGAERTALFAARLAVPHEAGKVVLLDVVDDEADADAVAEHLEDRAARIRRDVGVPCEVVVAAGDPLVTLRRAAEETGCDLVATPYEAGDDGATAFVRSVFEGPLDAVAFRSVSTGDRWRRVLVLMARPGDSAHAMVDFANRLARDKGAVSVCTCIGSERERRAAEARLANVVETVDGPVETRVARSDVESFVDAHAGAYDVVMLGSSGDRSGVSRIVSPPTFERLRGVDCDVAVVDRGDPH